MNAPLNTPVSPWMLLLADFVTGLILLFAILALAVWIWATSGCRCDNGAAPRCRRCGSRWHPDCADPRP